MIPITHYKIFLNPCFLLIYKWNWAHSYVIFALASKRMPSNDDHDPAEQPRPLWGIWQEALPLNLWSRSCFLVHLLILLKALPLSTAQTAIWMNKVEHIYNTDMLCFRGIVFIKGQTHHPPHLSEWLDIKTGSLHTLPVVWIHTSTPWHLHPSNLPEWQDRWWECLSRGAEEIP